MRDLKTFTTSKSAKPHNGSVLIHVRAIQSRSANYYDGVSSYSDPDDVTLPKFDTSVPHNVTAGLGFDALLKCRVDRLDDKMVSDSIHILKIYRVSHNGGVDKGNICSLLAESRNIRMKHAHRAKFKMAAKHEYVLYLLQ